MSKTRDIIQALDRLSLDELRQLSADDLRKFSLLCHHWSQMAEGEAAKKSRLAGQRQAPLVSADWLNEVQEDLAALFSAAADGSRQSDRSRER